MAMGNLNRFEQNITTLNSKVNFIKRHGRFNARTFANNLAVLLVG